jgi:release factor glutamine methyltransferase
MARIYDFSNFDRMSSLLESYHRFIKLLKNLYDPGEAESIAQSAFEEIFGTDIVRLRLKMQEKPTREQESAISSMLERLLNGEPLQYITGHSWFMGEKYLVNSSVLIPRQETEELVEWILSQAIPSTAQMHILDIGTGSGCIAISLKKRLKKARVSALDSSSGAVRTAKANAMRILGNGACCFFLRDITDRSWWKEQEELDIIVSNPPYITAPEKERMHRNVLAHEPKEALFVPGNDALFFYRHIADFAFLKLKKEGKLFLEINEGYGTETSEMLKEKGFSRIELRKDMQQKNRMICAVR